MKNNIVVYFSSNPYKEYKVASGSIFNKEFSETLDSATLILDDLSVENRLVNILPYEYVKVVYKGDSSLDIGEFYLVDNFVETEVNIVDHIYQYQINLMSETKYLEKIQLPNLVITHSLVSGKKTIYEHICQYMKLYCPKIKYTKGEQSENDKSFYYEYLYEWESYENQKKFGVECADLSFSQPTLRQLLTSLMLQVGCIPVIKNRKLTFIDFKEQKKNFIKDYSVNYIQKSLSSDSFVNTLVNNHSQVLDTSNEVITEYVGFRNRQKLILQQKDNLTIETKFPIYKINEVFLNVPIYYTDSVGRLFDFYAINNINVFEEETIHPQCLFFFNTYDSYGNKNGFKFDFYQSSSSLSKICKLKNLKIHFVKFNKENNFITAGAREVKTIILFKEGIELYHNGVVSNARKKILSMTDTTETLNEKSFYEYIDFIETNNSRELLKGFYWQLKIETNFDYDGVWVEYEMKTKDNNFYCFEPLNKLVDEGEKDEIGRNKKTTIGVSTSSGIRVGTIGKVDITDLFVENAKRNLLDTDYNNIPNNGKIKDLANNYYTTIGYSIGTKQISGFSSSYQIPVLWFQQDKVIFENILNFIRNNNLVKTGDNDIYIILKNYYGNMPKDATINNFDNDFSFFIENFMNYTFDIKYQPLNSYNLKHVKQVNDIPILIEQLDNAESGIIDFDRTAKMEQEKINRLGNDILAISQTTDDYSKVNDVNTLYDDYTVFKRTISVENEYLKVNYQASKNYVLQNYFSSITTKYRAYEYVDYSQSVIRKENSTTFVLIDTYKIKDGTQKIKLNDIFDESIFVSALYGMNRNPNLKIKFSYEKDSEKIVKNDVSVISTDNIIAFIYENYDNVSYGSKLKQTKVDSNLGGVIQEWIMHSPDYSQSHEVGFLYEIDIRQENGLNEIEKFYINLPEIVGNEDNVIFNLVDSVKSGSKLKTFYKDNAEIINQTVQFVYYTTNENIKWNHYFLDSNVMVNNNNNLNFNKFIDLTKQDFEINENEHSVIEKNFDYIENYINDEKIVIENDKIIINWLEMEGVTQFKVCWRDYKNEKEIDMIAFRKINEVDTWYISLNDTKSKYVYSTIGEGQKNLLHFDDKEETINGVTYSIKNGVFTLNGKATSTFSLRFYQDGINSGKYYLKWWKSGNVSSTVFGYLYNVGHTSQLTLLNTASVFERPLTLTQSVGDFTLYIQSGSVFDNLVLKPQLIYGSIPPSQFEQPENSGLLERVIDLSEQIV